MAARVRLVMIGLMGAGLLAAALLVTGRPSSAGLYSGIAQVSSGTLALGVVVDPPIAEPGDELALTASVVNRGLESASPRVVLDLPAGLSTDVFALPAGVTFNLQSRQITWLPVVGAMGQSASLSLRLRVESVDVTSPVHDVAAAMIVGSDEHRAAAQIWLGIPPMIAGGLQQARVAVGQPVRLQATIVGPGPIKEDWLLGDGRRLDVASPVVSYAAPGDYPVELVASNPAGSVRLQATITVVAEPVASFAADDDTPGIGQLVFFKTSSGGQPPLRYAWDFGDGSALSNEPEPSHSYAASGSYRVRLVVENGAGRSEAYAQINVGAPPVAEIMLAELGAVGLPLQGMAITDPSVNAYSWDMGDGRVLEGQAISHRYRLPGDYFVTLTAANDFGETRIGRWVRIEPGMTTVYLPSLLVSQGSEVSNLSADTTEVVALDPVQLVEDGRIVVPSLTFPAGTTPAEQLFAYLNEVRRQYGLGLLDLNNQLSNAAAGHSRDKVRYPDDPHTGTDGTTAAERILRAGFAGGYAGEATAWGFSDARQAVEFWMNSPSHQPMLLNRNATDVGVGYFEDYGSSNIWYWTADFGSRIGSPMQPAVRLMEPATGLSALDTDFLNYSWVWPVPLGSGQRFVVYLVSDDQRIPLGIVNQPVYGSRYLLSVAAAGPLSLSWQPAGLSLDVRWQTRLEDALGNVLAQSDSRTLLFRPDVAVGSPTATPPATLMPLIEMTPLPTALPTTIPLPPTAVPPTAEPPPVLVTATPLPPEFLVTATPQP